MNQVDLDSTHRKGLWAILAIAVVASASAFTMPLPAAANADPAPLPPSTATAAPSPAQEIITPLPGAPVSSEAQPGDPNAPSLDPNAPYPLAVDPNAGRITNAVGGFSFVLPAGWVESEASHLDYGSVLLSKAIEQPPVLGQPTVVATDTRIVLGRLDQKLYASAEADNIKAAVRLGSDMGEFYLPYPGTRIDRKSVV